MVVGFPVRVSWIFLFFGSFSRKENVYGGEPVPYGKPAGSELSSQPTGGSVSSSWLVLTHEPPASSPSAPIQKPTGPSFSYTYKGFDKAWSVKGAQELSDPSFSSTYQSFDTAWSVERAQEPPDPSFGTTNQGFNMAWSIAGAQEPPDPSSSVNQGFVMTWHEKGDDPSDISHHGSQHTASEDETATFSQHWKGHLPGYSSTMEKPHFATYWDEQPKVSYKVEDPPPPSFTVDEGGYWSASDPPMGPVLPEPIPNTQLLAVQQRSATELITLPSYIIQSRNKYKRSRRVSSKTRFIKPDLRMLISGPGIGLERVKK